MTNLVPAVLPFLPPRERPIEERSWLRRRSRARLRVTVVAEWPCGRAAAALCGGAVLWRRGGGRQRHLLQTSHTLVGRLCGLRKLLSEAMRTRAGALLLLRGSSECRSGALNEATATTRARRATRGAKCIRFFALPGTFSRGRATADATLRNMCEIYFKVVRSSLPLSPRSPAALSRAVRSWPQQQPTSPALVRQP